MDYLYPYWNQINLHVSGRISAEDAYRQEITAKNILYRLKTRPGVILADEVGMGKTFVALAVAVSVVISDPDKRPVVVMVPPSLKEKWPRDFELFKEKCLAPNLASQLKTGNADRAEQFLKLLDDPPERRSSLIFVTHGAMGRGLSDKWVKLAIIYQALRGRREVERFRNALSKIMGDLLYLRKISKWNGSEFWKELLSSHPSQWLKIFRAWEIDPEDDDDSATDDDPVPMAVWQVLNSLNTDSLFEVLKGIPLRKSINFEDRLSDARRVITAELKGVWETCVRSLNLRLPLLILDEAHHLKNPETRLAQLFNTQESLIQTPESQSDMETISRGPLGGVFERMLFLTATPFQLGHRELCSVLERFDAIGWNGASAPDSGKESFRQQLSDLRKELDAAQEAAVTLDTAWGHLGYDDLSIDGTCHTDVEPWWKDARHAENIPPQAKQVIRCYDETYRRMKAAENLLSPWVIRHLKARRLPKPYEAVPRRCRMAGGRISGQEHPEKGLEIEGDAVLPFLLAARATSHAAESRPVFAEGLASSYEAFLHTRMTQREEDAAGLDGDDELGKLSSITEASRWYLDQLEAIIPRDSAESAETHPKVAATVRKAVDTWKQGEKVLVFCHFIATGRALRQYISRAIDREICLLGSKKLGCSPETVPEEVERIGRRFFDEDSPIRKACDDEVRDILQRYPNLQPYMAGLQDLIRRNVRTPSFLVRFFPLGEERLTSDSMKAALESLDESGMTLRQLLENFFEFLEIRCGREDRLKYMDAASHIQTGSHLGQDVKKSYTDDELQGDSAEKLIPNVRLVNGTTKHETRQRLMLAFNTPFYPEILVASSVMAEGVDLQMNCRYIIHHDLCWNPSTLEQRTGRIDRVGAKVERCGQPIYVFLPFVGETQDEKMYRVVMDRERWFSVVMGEKYTIDAKTTDKLAQRVPFPESLAQELAFRLEVR